MFAYPGSSGLDFPSPEELSAVAEEARILKVLDSAIVLSHGASPDPL
jgi:hypothetical protein